MYTRLVGELVVRVKVKSFEVFVPSKGQTSNLGVTKCTTLEKCLIQIQLCINDDVGLG